MIGIRAATKRQIHNLVGKTNEKWSYISYDFQAIFSRTKYLQHFFWYKIVSQSFRKTLGNVDFSVTKESSQPHGYTEVVIAFEYVSMFRCFFFSWLQDRSFEKVAILFATAKRKKALDFYFLHYCGYMFLPRDVFLAFFHARVHEPLYWFL